MTSMHAQSIPAEPGLAGFTGNMTSLRASDDIQDVIALGSLG